MRCRQLGVSMVELLVGMAVGLFLTAGIIQLLVSSKEAYRSEEGFARLQEAGRFTVDVLARDLRMHGSMGCKALATLEMDDEYYESSGKSYWGGFNIITYDLLDKDGNRIFGTGSSDPLGYSQASASAAEKKLVDPSDEVTWKAGSDAVAAFGTFGPGFYLGKSMTENATGRWEDDLELAAGKTGIDKGDVMLITDCRNVDIFKVTNDPGSGKVIKHEKAVDYNRSAALSKVYHKASAADINAMVFPFSFNIYFIGEESGKPPTLYVTSLGSGGWSVQPLVENVEDMRVTYFGDDSDGTAGPDGYETAANVGNWSDIQSMHIEVLVRTDDEVLLEVQKYTFPSDAAAPTTPNDLRQREVFATTVAMRSRNPWRIDR